MKPAELDERKVVVDLCAHPLTTDEREVLSLGPKFAVAPRKVPYHDLLLSVIAASDSILKSDKPDCER